jgi:hypothetical protein
MKIGIFDALALITEEKPLLKAVYIPTAQECIILDKNGFCIESLDAEAFFLFMTGARTIVDNDGRVYHYLDVEYQTKSTKEEVEQFIKLLKNE